MAIRLYSEFKSDNGTQYKIEIHDASWVAAATTFNVDSRGFDLIYEGETDDIVSPIVSSRLTFGAYSENATFETFINTLKTFQENRFQLAVRKYNGASYDLIWAGWITQDLVSVEDESQPYIYEITATDGIGRLSNIDYTTANTISQANGFKATDIIAILKTAFVNIGTSDLWGAGDAFFETSIDWWETNYQTYATSTDPISQHAVDVRLFNEFDDDGNVVYSSTLDILRQIATLYNGRFYMQNGRFVFEQYGNRDTSSRYVSRYTKSATHLGRVLVSDDKTIDQTANAARRSGNGWDFLPATQTARVHYVQKFLNPFNAFGLFRFRNSTNAYTAGFIAGGSGIQLSIGSTSFNFKVTGSASLTSPIFPVFKMRIRIQDSSTGTYYYYNRSYNGVAAGGAMFGTPAWSTTSGFYYFDLPPFFTSGVSVVNQPVSIITDDMPVNGELDLQLTLHGVFRSKNGTTYTPSTTPLFDSIFVFGIQTNGSANAPGATFSSNNTTAGIDSKLTLDLGDLFIADGPRQTGHLAVFTGADWVGTSDWRKGSSGASLPILKLLTNETLALHVNPIEQYNGNVITSTLFGQRLVFNSAAYLMTGGTFNASSDEWSGTWYKIESVRANVTALTPVSDLVQKATIATATTSGSSSNDIIGGRIGGMVVDIEDQKIGPFQQTASGARLVGNTEITGTLDVDGAAQFNNDVNITGSVTSTGPLTGEYVQLDTTYNTTPIQGQIVWSQDDGTIDVGLNSNVTMQVGQEEFWLVKNQTGSTIPKGTAVRAAGTLGASGRILGAPMVADGSVPARFFLGIAAEDILNGGDGYVTTFGKIRQLNTSAFTEGSVLWCNPAVAGGLTATEPSAPNLKLAVAFVVRSNATSGVLAVRSEIGARVSDASDVQITSVADNDLLQYNTATSRWENVAGTTTNIAEGTNLYYTDARSRAAISETIDGVSYNNTTGVFSLDAGRVIVTTTQTGEWDTAYNDRIVSAAVTGTTSKTLTLTQGDGGTITATWSDYDTAPVTSVNGLTGDVVLTTTNIAEGTNLYYTDARARAALSAGVGISYNNATGVITNSAPDQVVAVTAGTGISVTGTYPNFTITNTSPSSGGTITGGGTTNYLSKWTGASALGDSLVFDNGTNVGIGTATPGYLLDVAGTSRSDLHIFRSNQSAPTADAFIFRPADNTIALGTANAERMRIMSGGNVGIGTTSPTTALDVNGTISSGGSPIAWFSGNYNRIFRPNGAVGIYLGNDTDQGNYYDNTTHYFRSPGGGTTYAVINNLGNVGIGTTSPTYKLQVNGDSYVGGNLTSTGYGFFNGEGLGASLRVGGIYGNLGLYVPSSYDMQFDLGWDGVFKFTRGGTERMRIVGSTGNVGIGTTNPDVKFQVQGGVVKATTSNYASPSTGGAISMFQDSNDYGTIWAVKNYNGDWANVAISPLGGNVGIGTTAPGAKLEIAGTNSTLALSFGNSVPNNPLFINTYGGFTGIGMDQTTAGLRLVGDSGGNNLVDVGYYSGNVVAHANWVSRMRVLGNGNVGIGTTAPINKLDIVDGALRVVNSLAGGEILAKLLAYTPAPFGLVIRGENTGATTIQVQRESNNAEVFALSLQPNGGNVGIGTTSPGQKLEVAGNIIATPGNKIGFRYDSSDANLYGYITRAGAGGVYPLTIVGGLETGGTTIEAIRFETLTAGTARMSILNNGNVGIGTTIPTAKLDVEGTWKLGDVSGGSFKSYTFGTQLDVSGITSGGWARAHKISTSDSSGHVFFGALGNNTTLTRAYWTIGDPASIDVTGYNSSNGVILLKNGNVGIGTAAPTARLHVSGGDGIINNAFIGEVPTYTSANAQFSHTSRAGAGEYSFLSANDGETFINSKTGTNIRFRVNNADKVIINSAGNVGINTTNPTQLLQVAGNEVTASKINAVGTIYGSGAFLNAFSSAGGNDVGFAGFIASQANQTNRMWAGVHSPSGANQAFIGTPDSMPLAFWTNSAEQMRITSAGNVGIGTTAPNEKLDVNGDVTLGWGANRAFKIKFYGGGTYEAGMRLASGTRRLELFSIFDDAAEGISFTTGTGASNSEKMRLTNAGNLGIGTDSPQSRLHIETSSSNPFRMVRGATNFGFEMGGGDIGLYNYSTSAYGWYLTAAGNVGIGTTAPTYKLQVIGGQFGTYLKGGDLGSGSDILRLVNASDETTTLFRGDGNVSIGSALPLLTNAGRGNLTINGSSDAILTLGIGNEWKSYYYTNSAGTYISSQGNRILDLETNGATRVRVSGDGNVGIGTTAPDKKLVVVGDGTGTAKIGIAGFSGNYTGISLNGTLSEGNYNILSSPTDPTLYINRPSGYSIQFRENNTSQMIIAVGGNVGIGTTDPQGKLDVTDGVVSVAIKSTLAVESSSNNQTLAQISFYKHYGLAIGSAIRMLQSGGTSNYPQAHLAFFTNDGSAGWSTPTERMRIKDGGNVGIGTADPTEKLHVDGNAILTYNNSYQGINSIGNKAILARVSPTTGIINYAEYATATNLNGFVMGSTATQLKGIFATNKLEFTTNSSTRMTITSGGLVGIGTTSPSHILHITDVMRMDNVSAYSPNLTSDSFAKHGYGDVSNDRYLAEPAIWFKINVDGTEYVIPGYTEVI